MAGFSTVNGLELPEPKFKHFLPEDGLSHQFISCLFQDRTGFLWIGTPNGLNRFDGYQFKKFRQDSTDSNSISSNNIQAIYEDAQGILWIATWQGLNRFDPATERFSCYKNEPGNPRSLSCNLLYSITADSAGLIWIASKGGGLNCFNPKSGEFFHWQYSPGLPNGISGDEVNSILVDRNQQLWVGTIKNGLCRLNLRPIHSRIANGFDKIENFLRNLTFTHFQHHPQNPRSLSNDRVGKIFESRDGTIWVGTGSGGLNRFVPESGDFIRCQNNLVQPKNMVFDFVTEIYEDHLGYLWMGSRDGGIKIFDDEIRRPVPRVDEIRPEQWLYDPNRPQSLSHNYVQAIYEDRNGIIWVGTISGLNMLIRNQPVWGYWQKQQNSSLDSPKMRILSICEDRQGAIWLGTEYGLLLLMNETKISNHTQAKHYYFLSQEKGILTENLILSIMEDRQGYLWLATANGIIRFNPATESAEHFGAKTVPAAGVDKSLCTNSLAPNLIPDEAVIIAPIRREPILDNPVVHAIIEDPHGVFWVGTKSGIQRLDWQQHSFRSFFPDDSNPYGLKGKSIRAMLADPDGGIWIGTGQAVNYLNCETEQFTAYYQDSGTNINVTSLYIGSDGHLWFGSKLGLSRLLRSDNHVEFVVPAEPIQSITQDQFGNFWLGTNQGMINYNPKTKASKKYGLSTVLPNVQFAMNSALKCRRSDFLLLGTLEGLVAFQPRLIHEINTPSPLVLTNFFIYNESLKIGEPPLFTSISQTRNLELTHDQNVLSFEFATLDFTNPLKNQFAYRLVPSDWVQIGNRHFLDLGRLPPDEYTLQVKGANSAGIWNNDGVELKFTIKPPLWLTWPAYLIYIMVAVGFLYSLWLFDHRRTQLRNELKLKEFQAGQLQELDRMKSRFFANISHEFRTPMTLILGPLEKWLSRVTDEEIRHDISMMQRNVHRLQRLINQLLDLSRLEAGKMELHPTTLDVQRLVERCFQSFESQAKIKSIQLILESSVSTLLARIDPDKLEIIIYNLLSNALKFTPIGGKVSVQLTAIQEPRMVEIQVRDDGVGIAADKIAFIFNRFYQVDDSSMRTQEGSGIGLSLTRELVELHGGSISVQSEPGAGTTFTVRLPVGNIDLGELKPDTPSETVPEPSEPAPDLAEIKVVTGGKSIVLIVEDNADLRRFIGEILQPAYQTLEAGDGEEGFALAQAHVPDLILSDVMMPRMDGFQMCEKIKTNEITSHIPVILLTARANRESKLEGLETGADDYLIKPFDAEELRVRIKNLITQRQRLRERFRERLVVEPREIAVTSADQRFLQRILNMIEEKISDPDFNTEEFSERIGLSRSQLHRKLHALTGQSTTEFIRSIRLKRAASLIKQEYGTISEIAYAVGFSHLSYFAECFRKEFGVAPSEYN